MGFSTFVSSDPVYDATLNRFVRGGAPMEFRTRHNIAQINAGAELLPALDAGSAYQLLDAHAIAIGGNASGATTVDITGTRSAGAVKLVAMAVAGLAQSAVLRAGASNSAVLADGASFTPLDGGTAINISKTGSALAGCTHVDVVLSVNVVKV